MAAALLLRSLLALWVVAVGGGGGLGATSGGCVLPSAYGAGGDGVHDDTRAIQLAIFGAFIATRDVRIPGWHNEQVGPDVWRRRST